MLKLENIRYEVADEKGSDKEILKNITLDIPEGKFVVITGPNGGGKSTLAKIIAGIYKPADGKIFFDGEDITDCSITDRANKGISFAFQQPVRFKGIEVLDLIRLAAKDKNLTPADACKYLSEVGLCARDYINREVDASLSGGELSRLRFAEILLERPNFLILDEPTNHLDIYMRESLNKALTAYTGTLLLVTHDRYLMNSLGCPILYLEGEKGTFYAGYSQLLAHTSMEAPRAAAQRQQEEQEKAHPQRSQKEERRLRAEVRNRSRELEREIETLAADILEMEQEISLPEIASDHLKLTELCDKLDDAKFHQNELYDAWEKLLEEYGEYLE